MTGRQNTALPIDKLLFKSKTDKVSILSGLKNLTLLGFKNEIKKAYRHPFTKSCILSNTKPDSYAKLRDTRLSYFTNNLEGEIAWVLESIIHLKDDINEFVILEQKIQNSILLGDNKKAKETLDQVNQNICYSYWGLEINYYLLEKMDGTEGNWKFSGEINSSVKNPYTLFFSQILSKKAEQGVSCSDYHRSLQNEIRSISKHDFEYLNYKLSYHLLQDYTEYPFFIYADSSSSIIDRYISLISLISELVSSNEKTHNEIAKNVILELGEIKDQRIDRFKEFCGLKETSIESSSIVGIFESYTLGEFEKCINQIPEVLKNKPNEIALWEIYSKSLIESGVKFVNPNISEYYDSLINRLYDIYLIKDNSNQKAEELLKLIISVPSLSFAKQLLTLISSTLGLYSTKNIIFNNFYFYSSKSNPIIFLFSESVKPTSEFDNLISSQSVKLIAGKKADKASMKSILSTFKYNLYKFRRYFQKEKYDECVKLGRSFQIENIKGNVFVEEIIYKLFHSYTRLDKLDDAVKTYVSAYFLNQNLVKKINAKRLINKIIDTNYSINGNIDSALFFTLNDLENYHCFVTIEMWLDSIGVDKPSEISLPTESNELRKHLFLLDHGCSIEVLEKFYYQYETKEDVIEERKLILSILIQNELINSEKYINELSIITQKGKIQSILYEVNSGRIRLTKSMMESSSDNNFQNSYNRYKLLTDFTDNYDFEGYDTKTLLKNFLDSLADNKNHSSNPSFLSFKSLVNELIDGFLFNKKNGLDGELSTRIRHGELENQIRSVFDRKHLISKKDDSNDYTNIDYWDNQFQISLEHSELNKLQNILKKFSLKIDSIIQYLVREYVQVKSENYPDKQNAFFNYYFTDNYFKVLYEDSKRSHDKFEDFVDYIYSVLQLITESNLRNISDYLVNTLRKKVDEELDLLGEEISSLSNSLVQLNQNIIDAKVEFQNDILDIANWFVVADSAIDAAMDVKTIIECSFESSNLKHPNRIINPVISADDKLFVSNYKHYIFILINLIENIRVHSKLSTSELQVFVNVLYENNFLIFSVKNNFDISSTDVIELDSVFRKIKDNWNKEVVQEYVNKESGSGYEKIKKILLYDVKSKKNFFDFKVEQEYLEVIFEVAVSSNYEI